MDKRQFADVVFVFLMHTLEREPKAILRLEYKAMLKTIFILFSKGKIELCTKCVLIAYEKHGQQLFKDLESEAADITLKLINLHDNVKSS